MKRLFLFFLFIIHLSVIYAQSLQHKLDSLLVNTSLLKTSEVGITIFDLTTGQTLFQHQDEKLYRPASTEKVIT